MSEFLKHCQENPKMADLEVKIEELESQRDALAKENERLKEKFRELFGYTKHDFRCVLRYFEAGEPTKKGGYRTKYMGKWYQTKPVDQTPKCSCGLDDILSAFCRETKDDNE